MNTLFALIIITATGPMEAHSFATMGECQSVLKTLKSEAFCAEKKAPNVEAELDKMFTILRSMKARMESL